MSPARYPRIQSRCPSRSAVVRMRILLTSPLYSSGTNTVLLHFTALQVTLPKARCFVGA